MILRPVRPQSPCGPPVTKRPVGLMKYFVFSSSSSAGTTGLDHLLEDVLAHGLDGNEAAVLGGDDDGVHAHRPVALVLDRDLALAVGPQVVDEALAADLRQAAGQLVRQHDRQRHQLGRLAAGVAEHQALVAGAPGVDTHRDVRRLLVDRGDDRAGLVVEAVLGAGVADVLDRLPDDRGEVDVRRGGDLAGDEGEPGRDHGLARHAAHGVLGDQRVEDGIGDLVGDLVGVSLGHGLRRKQVTAILCHSGRSLPPGHPRVWGAHDAPPRIGKAGHRRSRPRGSRPGSRATPPSPRSQSRSRPSPRPQARGWNLSYSCRSLSRVTWV